jgi:hypothetical protein
MEAGILKGGCKTGIIPTTLLAMTAGTRDPSKVKTDTIRIN